MRAATDIQAEGRFERGQSLLNDAKEFIVPGCSVLNDADFENRIRTGAITTAGRLKNP